MAFVAVHDYRIEREGFRSCAVSNAFVRCFANSDAQVALMHDPAVQSNNLSATYEFICLINRLPTRSIGKKKTRTISEWTGLAISRVHEPILIQVEQDRHLLSMNKFTPNTSSNLFGRSIKALSTSAASKAEPLGKNQCTIPYCASLLLHHS